MKHHRKLLFFIVLLPLIGWAQEQRRLSLPRQEQLSSQRVSQVIQDSEGFLWYATEGGGVCRDDGRRMTVFRSDAEHPDLLCSNDVACVAEASGRYIIIGTFHGANLLDKHDYSIRRLEDVDDKRVDDIIVSKNGHWWMTANKKVYEYDDKGQLLNVYPGGDKYIFRLHEDQQGRLWCAEWDGGLLRLDDGHLVAAPWPVDAAPTTIDDDPAVDGGLLIGTFGRGVVKYHSISGSVEQTNASDSISMSRVSLDLQGRALVADGLGNCYVLTNNDQEPWYHGQTLTRFIADSVQTAYGLSARPTAFAKKSDGELWFSTGKDIRLMKQGEETIALPDMKDVSAMTFTKDGTLWLATIFGTLMTYKDGQLQTDEYASNEYGDAIVALQEDSEGLLTIVSNRHIRKYDPVHRTLRQQNIEDADFYCLELQETQPGKRWSQPEEEVVERMPQWIWWLLAALFVILFALVAYIWHLHQQRKRFLAALKKETPEKEQAVEAKPIIADKWLQKVMATVEQHIADNNYSVEQLSSDLNMSRMTFYRKIQSATGQKPTEFIRTIRLHHAAALLREGNMTITEISYAAGFSSVSYFSRCFRSMYGVPPTQYQNKPDKKD
ncbi:MAG: helix-turn-helix domain-containing protein [Prevotella sp.]|nr:helix-turn-helix domain-containing protein [Prevotella sp.]